MREKPIVRWLQNEPGSGEYGFMTGAADLEEKAILAFELDLAIVQTPGHEHGAIDADERFALEAVVFCRVVIR
jgi:hypothetical protein